ncbi:MAG: protein kinase [Rhizobiaceae bacterium]
MSGIYELDERIASGGMGEVYRGHNIQTGDKVAIKIVLPEFARDQTILALFRKEASILNHLSHDAIVRYHVFTIDAGIQRPYLAMEFVDGDALFDIIKRGPMSMEEVRRLCHRLALGLRAVHEAGAVHRDLSPDNIILPGGRVERAKIIDFGIARSSHVGGETLIGGKFAGKYNYVSPEQLGLNGGEVSDKSDIYSLGLVMAAALLGKPLEMSGSQLDIVEKRRTVPDLSEIDPAFRPVIEGMLQPDPHDRPSSAELADMTSPVAFGEAGSQTSVAMGDKGREDRSSQFVPHRPAQFERARPAAPPPRPAPGPKAPVATGRLRNLAIGGAAAVLVLAGIGAYAGGLFSSATTETADVKARTDLAPAPEPAEPVAEDEAAPPAPAEEVASAAPDSPAETVAPAEDAPPAVAGQPEPDAPAETDVAAAMPVPEPEAPPTVDPVEVVDWVNTYDAGACFHASTTATPDSITIDGYGASVDAFDRMAAAVQSEFGLAPQLNIRAIEPAQCAVPAFAGDASAGATPTLALEQTAIRDGTPVVGTLTTAGDGDASVFLVDHKGMVFNLTERFDLRKPSVDFSIPLGLGGADKATGRALPQMLVAVSGTRGIGAANFTRPVPADQLFQAMTEEFQAQGRSAKVAVQVFELGG